MAVFHGAVLSGDLHLTGHDLTAGHYGLLPDYQDGQMVKRVSDCSGGCFIIIFLTSLTGQWVYLTSNLK